MTEPLRVVSSTTAGTRNLRVFKNHLIVEKCAVRIIRKMPGILTAFAAGTCQNLAKQHSGSAASCMKFGSGIYYPWALPLAVALAVTGAMISGQIGAI
jgi:hypothetical protein